MKPTPPSKSLRPVTATRRHSTIEPLEARIAPATFTGAGTVLTIDLNTANELVTFHTDGTTITAALTGGTAVDGGGTGGHVSGFGTSTALIASAFFTSITITDSAAGDSVTFADSTGNYPQGVSVTLDSAASGNLTFAGASTFGTDFTATTTAGFIASDAGSSLTLTGAGSDLALAATGHDILLKGRVLVGGATSLTANVIEIDNAANDFTGALQLNGPVVASVFDTNDLNLGASSLSFGTLGQTTHITAGGNITQTGALTATAGSAAALAISSTGGSITLLNAANNISSNVAVVLSVTGSNTVSFFDTTSLTLGDVKLGTGALALTASGNITQRAGTMIDTDGAATFTVGANNSDILLGNAGNHIAGVVTIAETGAGFVRDVNLRNADDNASAPVGTPLTTANDVRNLTLFFDNNGIALPGYNITGLLNVTAGGDITQTAALTIAGTTTATILGDFGINLTTATNSFTGAVSLNDHQSTQPVQLTNATALTLGACDLGRGTLNLTAVAGTITSTGAITQEKGAGLATFSVASGNTISLTMANDFTGDVSFLGATTVNVRNLDFMASFAHLMVPASVTDLTVTFDNASAALPAENRTNLAVAALGIVQQTGTSLVLSGTGTFAAGAFPLNLSNTGNDFTNLNLSNGGRNDVIVTDVNALVFSGNSSLGSGRLTVLAGGNITALGAGRITESNSSGPVGDVSLTSTSGSVTLNGNNAFRGAFSVSVTGTNTAGVTNNNVTLTLGHVTTGTGAFTITAGTQSIDQDPNSVLSFGGTSSFTAGATIVLTNSANTFTSAVALSATTATLDAAGPVVLAASNVTGTLSIKTRGTASDSITQSGAITGTTIATFNSGAGNVTLTDAANNFNQVRLTSTGNVSITDTNALVIGTSQLGGGTLTIKTGGNLTSGGGIVQSGAGAVTFDTPAANNVTLNNSGNLFRGTLDVLHSATVNLRSTGDVLFTPTSIVTGNLTATAGGIIALPSDLSQLDSLTLSAFSTTISSDVTLSSGSLDITGTVVLSGDRTITLTASSATFRNDLIVGGALTFNLGAAATLQHANGTWNQGSHPLTINGTPTTTFFIGGTGVENFNMTSGTISMPGGGPVTVLANATFHVGATDTPETVTIANGGGILDFQLGSALAVGLGATNDQLIKTGTGNFDITGALFVGSGLAGVNASPVLIAQTGLVTGRFANSVDAADAPLDFFAGSDIVRPAYDFTQMTVKAGGIAAPGGTISGFLPDGDKYTVTSSLGANAGLAIVENPVGFLEIVVRNNTAASASTLSISTSGGGDNFLPINGVMVHTPGAVSISAPAANFTGILTTAGTLTSFVAHDLGVASLFTLSGGGPASGKTSITAHVVSNTRIGLTDALDKFKAVAVSNSNARLTADKFGALTTTGEIDGTGLVNPGDFLGNITSTAAPGGMVLSSANIAGAISGSATWDLGGSVGTVKVGKVSGWTFGTRASATARNGGLLTDVKSLSLGQVIDSMTMNASGMVAALTASDIAGSGNTFTAGSFGTVKVTGNLALGLAGHMSSVTLTATSNIGGIALKSLTVAGDMTNVTMTCSDGDIGSVVVGHSLLSTTINATDINGHGNIKSISASRWSSVTLNARTAGTLKAPINLAAGLLGDVSTLTATFSGNTAGLALNTFDAKGNVTGSTFNIENGNVNSIKVGRTLGSTSVNLTEPAFGNLGIIQAGDWGPSVNVLAKTIGTVASVGAAAVGPASPLLPGIINSDTITAYQNSGTAAAIGKLNAKGDLTSSTVNAEHGIGSMTVGRTVNMTFIVADDAMSGALNVGRIATLTAGAWLGSSVSANTFGAVKITGFPLPEGGVVGFAFGDVSGTFLAHGSTPTKPIGIDTFSVGRNVANSVFTVPFGIKTLTAGGNITASTIATDNPASPASGVISAFTAGGMDSSIIRAGSIGTFKTKGSVPFALLGSITNSTIAINSALTTRSGPQALGALTVNGDFTNSVLDAPANVGAISVIGRIASPNSTSRIEAGYAAGSKLGSLTAGAFGNPADVVSTDLVAQSVGTFKLVGNAKRGFIGAVDHAFIDILGNSGGVGLGTFSATGTATDSLFRVSDGDVTSFTAQRLVSSDLLVGFRFVKASDITKAPTAAEWSATNHKLGTFKTTAPFDATDADSASFVDSNVIASILGSITLSGVNPDTLNATAFGVAFRTTGGAAGVVKTNGSAAPLAPGATTDQFNYLGLAG